MSIGIEPATPGIEPRRVLRIAEAALYEESADDLAVAVASPGSGGLVPHPYHGHTARIWLFRTCFGCSCVC
ncbi:MAG: hypothetical protein WCI74_21245 [Actinomycetes bacterium]